MAELRIGTSGWNYRHWKGVFYPGDVAQRRWLQYYSEHFNTAEVNYSFYRLPSESTYEKWRQETPSDFLFALKCSRLITHAKRLNVLGDLWENFLSRAVVLKRKLGPILCQFPETFEIDLQRLDDFLSTSRGAIEQDADIRLAVEFRHESWFTKKVYRLLEKHNVALVIADSAEYPRADIHTADFAYYRYHGPTRLFASSYSHAQLEKEARKMSKCLRQKMDTFAYFNNDGYGYAVKNSLLLKDLLEDRKSVKTG